MATIKLAPRNICTACGACAYVCSKSCIKMAKDPCGALYPVIDNGSCIGCKRCVKACPVLSPVNKNTHLQTFASWNLTKEDRKKAASGGIATALYKLALKEGWYVVGASMNKDFLVSLQVTNEEKDLVDFRNSKYVFSEPYYTYGRIKQVLDNKGTVLIVALPCQIAAFKKVFAQYENLYYIDLICHGIISSCFFQQHINNPKINKGENINKVFFRDPKYHTYTFTFTLYNENEKCVYMEEGVGKDLYQNAYHDAIAYRENCYHCQFASENRVSDLTLGDYYGLGVEVKFNFPKQKVSCVLVNSSKGKKLLDNLILSKMIEAIERPNQEVVAGNRMLCKPCVKSRKRKYFEHYISRSNGDFNIAMSAVMRRYYKWELLNNFILCVKRFLRHCVR